jgi:hypothetical protein
VDAIILFGNSLKHQNRARASSLRDLLRNRTVALDAESALRLLQGVVRGMAFLHARSVMLRSTCSHWHWRIC